MKKFLTVALAGVLAASMLFTGCSKKEESKDYVWVLKKELENTYALPSAFEIFRKIL